MQRLAILWMRHSGGDKNISFCVLKILRLHSIRAILCIDCLLNFVGLLCSSAKSHRCRI